MQSYKKQKTESSSLSPLPSLVPTRKVPQRELLGWGWKTCLCLECSAALEAGSAALEAGPRWPPAIPAPPCEGVSTMNDALDRDSSTAFLFAL